MSYSGFNVQGGLTTCYPFYERFLGCIKRETLPVKMCSIEGEDFLECINRKKQYALNYKLAKELRQYKILSIPKYDVENDQFIVNNELPSADVFFKQNEAPAAVEAAAE